MTATENKINHIVAITNGSDIYFPKKLMQGVILPMIQNCFLRWL